MTETYDKTITHNLFSASGATGVITQFWTDGYKILPNDVEIDTGNQLTATFTKGTSAANISAVVRKSDYTHLQTSSSSTWSINHNLNSDSLICQIYSSDKEVLPLNIQHDFNDSTITFDEALTGSAEFIWVRTTFEVVETVPDPSGLSLSVSGSYWKVGIGTTEGFDATDANDIESVSTSGSLLRYYTSTLDSDVIILEFDVSDKTDINITEIGIFNDFGRLMFYTKCSPLFKPSETTLKLFYKIRKFE